MPTPSRWAWHPATINQAEENQFLFDTRLFITTDYRFWQRGGGYDRNLTEPKSIWAEIDYFHANPVRRGLCDTPTARPWSSARELEQPGSGLLRLDLSSLPRTLQG
jgi:hypothetical protein